MPQTALRPLYSRAVLGLNGGPTDALVVRLGCELARGRNMELIALHVIEVDWRHDLSDDLATRNEQASAVLDMAESIAEQDRVTLRTELLQARDVGAALVDEAAELDADVMIVGLPYRQRFGGDFAIGDVIPYVFQNASCNVIVARESVPDGTGRRADRSAISFGRAP
ncbi:MAG: universal stress protein [Chloroflexi bacterium]|nr:universal stress protein [Chloroflexota bacterium]MBA3852623.1 universal stress protein [Chloroflexota bacterium]MDQ3407472.1 universal stress protein [Chloroflexota bacterium]